MDFTRLGPAARSRILVIGGCGGIGSAIVEAVRGIGCDVAVMDLPASIKATSMSDAIGIDLKASDTIAAAFEALDALDFRPDHVVFASGYTADLTPVRNMNPDVLDDVMDGNLRGIVLAAKAALARMDAGSLVFLSTAIGQVGAPGYGPYGMAKGGLNALVRTIAAEEAAQAIRANAVAPGPVLTPFVRGGMGRGVKDTSTEAQPTRFDADAFAKRIPMGRLGEPDDVAGPVLFLMSEAARYITGQVIHVNGGAFMRD